VKTLAGALGIKRFRLFGASYGSHLGIAIVRYHPEVVDFLVFPIGRTRSRKSNIRLCQKINGCLLLDSVIEYAVGQTKFGSECPVPRWSRAITSPNSRRAKYGSNRWLVT
jgi:pimeloyl-ACP methyl ester carboxylesterase